MLPVLTNKEYKDLEKKYGSHKSELDVPATTNPSGSVVPNGAKNRSAITPKSSSSSEDLSTALQQQTQSDSLRLMNSGSINPLIPLLSGIDTETRSNGLVLKKMLKSLSSIDKKMSELAKSGLGSTSNIPGIGGVPGGQRGGRGRRILYGAGIGAGAGLLASGAYTYMNDGDMEDYIDNGGWGAAIGGALGGLGGVFGGGERDEPNRTPRSRTPTVTPPGGGSRWSRATNGIRNMWGRMRGVPAAAPAAANLPIPAGVPGTPVPAGVPAGVPAAGSAAGGNKFMKLLTAGGGLLPKAIGSSLAFMGINAITSGGEDKSKKELVPSDVASSEKSTLQTAMEYIAPVAMVLGRTGPTALALEATNKVVDNYDELRNTGKMDPMKQFKQAGEGLQQVFSATPEEGFFSWENLKRKGGGLLNFASGTIGASVAGLTQIADVTGIADLTYKRTPEEVKKVEAEQVAAVEKDKKNTEELRGNISKVAKDLPDEEVKKLFPDGIEKASKEQLITAATVMNDPKSGIQEGIASRTMSKIKGIAAGGMAGVSAGTDYIMENLDEVAAAMGHGKEAIKDIGKAIAAPGQALAGDMKNVLSTGSLNPVAKGSVDQIQSSSNLAGGGATGLEKATIDASKSEKASPPLIIPAPQSEGRSSATVAGGGGSGLIVPLISRNDDTTLNRLSDQMLGYGLI